MARGAKLRSREAEGTGDTKLHRGSSPETECKMTRVVVDEGCLSAIGIHPFVIKVVMRKCRVQINVCLFIYIYICIYICIYIYIYTYIYIYIPVVPHKAVAEVSRIGNL